MGYAFNEALDNRLAAVPVFSFTLLFAEELLFDFIEIRV